MRVNQLHEAQLEVEALFLPVVQIVEGAQHDLQVARDLFFREEKGSACGAGALVGGDLEEFGLLAAELGHERVTEVAHDLAREGLRAMSSTEEFIELTHYCCTVASGNSFENVLEDGVRNRAHEVANLMGFKNGVIAIVARR